MSADRRATTWSSTAAGVKRLAPEVAILRSVGSASKSVWVDIRTTQQVVAVGFRTVLQQASGPLEITLDAPAAGGEPDVVLYDVINLNDGDDSDLDHLLKNTVSTVIAIDRTLKPELGTRAKDKGVEWAITLDVTPEDLIEVIGDAVSGHLEDCPVAQEWDSEDFLGAAANLSRRESEVLQAGRPGAQQPGDRRHHLRQCELGEDLHPFGLSQDQGDHPASSHRLGDPSWFPHRAL